MTASLIVRIALVMSIVAMMLVIAGILWGGLFRVGTVLMAVSMVVYGAAGVMSVAVPATGVQDVRSAHGSRD